MEIAKFVLTAIGTFLSVFGLSFTIFQYWRKKQDEKFNLLKTSMENGIANERRSRVAEIDRLARKVEKLEDIIYQKFEQRLSTIEGILKGMRPTLDKIQEWFVNNTPRSH